MGCSKIIFSTIIYFDEGIISDSQSAHKEPFGLTPIEAFSIGTPAIFVDEGGFRDSIIDGECGRLLPRDDYGKWHEALNQCRDKETPNDGSCRQKKNN